MPRFRYVVPIGKQQLWVEGDAKTMASLFAQIAELADVFTGNCGQCGSDDLAPRTFRGKYMSYELTCRACGYRLRVNDRKDGGLYIKDRTWQPPYQRGAGAGGTAPDGESESHPDEGGGGDGIIY